MDSINCFVKNRNISGSSVTKSIIITMVYQLWQAFPANILVCIFKFFLCEYKINGSAYARKKNLHLLFLFYFQLWPTTKTKSLFLFQFFGVCWIKNKFHADSAKSFNCWSNRVLDLKCNGNVAYGCVPKVNAPKS